MKILFLGEIGPGQTSLMRMKAFARLGHEVRGVHTSAPWRALSWTARQVERRLGRGTAPRAINAEALAMAREFRPDMVWAEKQEYLSLDTLAEMKRLGARLVHFTPDPYFSLYWKRTRAMDRAIGGFDALVYCKAYEAADYAALGKPLVYMPLGYCDEVHRPLPSDDPQWACALGFLGGWEARREHLLHGVAAAGVDLQIRGGNWDHLHDGRWSLRRHIILRQLAGGDPWRFHHDPLIASAHRGDEVYADDYARALTGARIGLGFLRKVCADQHTTRTFEIPACGSMLLADRTDEHCAFFAEGREAEFFSSEEELVDKARFFAGNEPARARIAAAGHRRCESGRYAYVHRLADVLAMLAQVQ